MNVSKMSNAELDAIAIQSDGDGKLMIRKVHSFLGRFVSFPCEHSQTAYALWIVHTHLMERWDSTPRIAFLSAEPESGKTRALEIGELLVHSPVMAVNVTPSYLFRKIGADAEAPPTILYDEIDTVFGPKAKENEEIRGLLNAGHRRGAIAGRCVYRGKNVETEDISAYCAVALAGIGWLPDTILSRSIIIRMRRRKADEQIESYRRRLHEPEGEQVRRLIEKWVASDPEINLPDELPESIQDRDADIWEPLIAIADAIGGEWPDKARKAAIALISAGKDADPSLGILLLSHMKVVFGDDDKIASETALSKLKEIEEAPWNDLRDKPLDKAGLAKRLRQYGIKPGVIRVGTATPRGYERADFVDVWARYLPAEAQPANEPAQANVAPVAPVAGLPGRGVLCAQCQDGSAPMVARRNGASEVWLHRECIRFYERGA